LGKLAFEVLPFGEDLSGVLFDSVTGATLIKVLSFKEDSGEVKLTFSIQSQRNLVIHNLGGNLFKLLSKSVLGIDINSYYW
jgi:hypothetical protein